MKLVFTSRVLLSEVILMSAFIIKVDSLIPHFISEVTFTLKLFFIYNWLFISEIWFISEVTFDL